MLTGGSGLADRGIAIQTMGKLWVLEVGRPLRTSQRIRRNISFWIIGLVETLRGTQGTLILGGRKVWAKASRSLHWVWLLRFWDCKLELERGIFCRFDWRRSYETPLQEGRLTSAFRRCDDIL